MRKFKSRVGYLIYEATAADTEKLGGFGICDNCSSYSETGFLVAVLNHYMCCECFAEWDNGSRMYLEDLHVERKREAYYDYIFDTKNLKVEVD